MPSVTLTQVYRFLAFILLSLCFIQLVSSTPLDKSAAQVAVANKNAEIAKLANAALTSQNVLTPLAVVIVFATSSMIASLA